MTIRRVWHGWTTPQNAPLYRQLLEQEIRPGLEARAVPGYQGLELLTRELGDEVEFMTIMSFDSLRHVIEFLGEDHERAWIPEQARALLSRWDEVCVHYETDA